MKNNVEYYFNMNPVFSDLLPIRKIENKIAFVYNRIDKNWVEYKDLTEEDINIIRRDPKATELDLLLHGIDE